MLGKSKIKYIQSLGHKKHRDEEGLFVAEGPKIVAELFDAVPAQISAVYALRGWIDAQAARSFDSIITEIDEMELAKISQLHTPNQVLALVRKSSVEAASAAAGTITLALDTIQDPGNLGTLIRIADWFGISDIVCNIDCADCYNPKVVQSTMGSIARVRVHYLPLAEWLQQQTLRIYAAALDGQDVTGMKRLNEGIIVIGNESKGISPEVFEQVNVRITIPGSGRAESLNAAVAGGIILSHLR